MRKDTLVISQTQLDQVTANQSWFKKALYTMVYWMNRISYILLKSKIFLIVINVFICYSLIGDYFRIMVFQNGADIGFDVITIFCILIFSFEILMQLSIQ